MPGAYGLAQSRAFGPGSGAGARSRWPPTPPLASRPSPSPVLSNAPRAQWRLAKEEPNMLYTPSERPLG